MFMIYFYDIGLANYYASKLHQSTFNMIMSVYKDSEIMVLHILIEKLSQCGMVNKKNIVNTFTVHFHAEI